MVVPLFNEAAGLLDFHAQLSQVLHQLKTTYEIIYVDDGSQDNTTELITGWHARDKRIRLVKLSRNFGKENALTAGIATAWGQAIITLDGDGQHPAEYIPKFIALWRKGAKVVIGVRDDQQTVGPMRRLASALFYASANKLGGQKLVPGSTDFRLIDRQVQQAFLGLNEHDRMTRGLIDWLGFERALIPFTAKPRVAGTASYYPAKLVRLAFNTFIMISPKPLYLFGYLGVLITIGSFLLGSAVFVEQFLFADPWSWKFSGTACLGILIVFLVGLVLMGQGIMSFYISHINNQANGRPLYVIDIEQSINV